MDPQRRGWARLQDRGGDDSSSSSTISSGGGGGKTTTPRPPNTLQGPQEKTPPLPEYDEEAHPQAPRPKPKAKPQAKGKGKATPPPNPSPPLCKKGGRTPMGMCRVWGTPGMSLGPRGAMGGLSAK